jgi:hypothetical protein
MGRVVWLVAQVLKRFWAGSIKGDVKKKHFSLRIRG